MAASISAAKVWIGNIPRACTEEELRAAFAAVGKIVHVEVAGARGFGWVTFDSAATAQKAVTTMHGKDIGGRPATVEVQRAKPGRDSRDARAPRAAPAAPRPAPAAASDPTAVFVGALPTGTTVAEVLAFFGGDAVKAEVAPTAVGCRAYVFFKSEAAAKAAIAAKNNTKLKEATVRVEHVRVPGARPPRPAGGDAESKAVERAPRAAAPRHAPSPHSVFVGKLAHGVTASELAAHFAPAGHCEVTMVNFKNIAFLKFGDAASVEKALRLNDSMLKERAIKVEREVEKPPRAAGAAHRAPASGGSDATTVFVGGLSGLGAEEALAAFFGGDVTRVEVSKNGSFAYVSFKNGAAAARALEKNGKLYEGQAIRVEVKQVKASSGARVGGGGGGGGGGYDSYDRPARAPRAAAAPKGAPIPDRIFVGNVPRELSNAKLAETFAVCGKVLLASMAGAKGFGYVTFETPAGAAAAVARFNGKDIGGRPARVELATTPDNGLRK